MLGAVNTDNASGGEVVASREGSVTTQGAFSSGGVVQSIGGGGGRLIIVGGDGAEGAGQRTTAVTLGADPSYFNDGGAVHLTLTDDIQTSGDNASGQIVQSIGAGGGEVYLVAQGQATAWLGASDGSTGDGGLIAVVNDGDITTRGARSHGFVLQSIGGGGGLVGTDLAPSAVELVLSADNGGDGGEISFTNQGSIITLGESAVGVLAQSLGGGGGTVDGLFRGSAGGDGSGGKIDLALTGNILSLGENGIAVMAQSAGGNGADTIDVALDGVIIGGSGDPPASADHAGPAGDTAGPAAIVIDGGTDNTLSLSIDSFLAAVNNRIISGGSGSEQVTLNGRAVGNVDLGDGLNEMTVSQGASFYAQDQVNLGAAGIFRVNGHLFLGGSAFLPDGALGAQTSGADFDVTSNVSQTTDVTGSVLFGDTAVYTPDVYFRQDGASGGDSDLINVSGDATIAGTVRPVLQLLERAQPLVLINADGTTGDEGTTVVGTPVITYQIGLNGPTGDGSTIDLVPHVDFRMPDMNRNQTLTAEHMARVLTGEGSADMGRMFALIANMPSSEEVAYAVDRFGSEDYAATQVDALNAGYRFVRTMANCGYDPLAAESSDDKSCYWISGRGGSLQRDASAEYRSLETKSVGFSGGVRIPLPEDLYLGLGAGLEDFSLASGDRFSAEGVRSELAVSLSKFNGPWEFQGILNGNTARYDATRWIDLGGSLPNGTQVTGGVARVDQRVSLANFRLGAGYRYVPDGAGVYLRPGLDFDVSYLNSAGASEWNTEYGLQLRNTGQWLLSATPSLEMGLDLQSSDTMRMEAYLRGEVSLTNKDDVFVNATFAGASQADGVYRNYSAIGDVTGRVNAGLTFSDSDNTIRATVGYQGQWSKDTVGHAASASFGFRF
jgi:hypothetical protein